MKCSLGISNFLEEISNLSHSIVFFYFFALITEEGFLISPCYCWYSAFKWEYLAFSLLFFASLLFSVICKASWDRHFAFLHFFFLGMVFIPASCTMPRTSVHSSFQALCLSDLIPWIYFSLPLYNRYGIWFRSYLNGQMRSKYIKVPETLSDIVSYSGLLPQASVSVWLWD